MLKVLAGVAGVVSVVIAFVLIYAATLPDEFRIVRSASIQAPRGRIFALINDLKSFNRWNPFARQDPTMVVVYNESTSGKGAGFVWNSDGRGGKGSLAITDSAPASRVAMSLDMEKPIAAHNAIAFDLRENDGATDVSWTMTGTRPYVAKVMGVVFNMDKMVGGEFAKGLAGLKTLAEAS
jgi:uncharacterized protein YndB with AHSA1/START domain